MLNKSINLHVTLFITIEHVEQQNKYHASTCDVVCITLESSMLNKSINLHVMLFITVEHVEQQIKYHVLSMVLSCFLV